MKCLFSLGTCSLADLAGWGWDADGMCVRERWGGRYVCVCGHVYIYTEPFW